MTNHDHTECFDPTCNTCLTQDRLDSRVTLEALLLDGELAHPDGAWIDMPVTISALDLRNVLDLIPST